MKEKSRKTRTITTEDRCPKCNGLTLELDQEGDIHCWSCSSTFIGGKVEGNPHRDYLLERHQFYENNKPALLADISAIGGKKTAEKWGISWGSLYHVLRRWGYEPKNVADPPEQVDESPDSEKRSSTSIDKSEEKIDQKIDSVKMKQKIHENGRLPAFPEFSNEWDPTTQCKWLEIYEKLFEKVRKDGQESQVRQVQD